QYNNPNHQYNSRNNPNNQYNRNYQKPKPQQNFNLTEVIQKESKTLKPIITEASPQVSVKIDTEKYKEVRFLLFETGDPDNYILKTNHTYLNLFGAHYAISNERKFAHKNPYSAIYTKRNLCKLHQKGSNSKRFFSCYKYIRCQKIKRTKRTLIKENRKEVINWA